MDSGAKNKGERTAVDAVAFAFSSENLEKKRVNERAKDTGVTVAVLKTTTSFKLFTIPLTLAAMM